MEIIYLGVAGKARAGKDTFAGHLAGYCRATHQCTVRRRAFADALKMEVAEFVGGQLVDSPLAGPNRFQNAAMVSDCLYSSEASEKEPYRLLMQWWGTEFRRRWFSPDHWLAALETWVQRDVSQVSDSLPLLVIVPDVRFPNEAAFIRDRGGLLVEIRRSLPGPSDPHRSETALADFGDWDWHVVNDGTLPQLRMRAYEFFTSFVQPRLQP